MKRHLIAISVAAALLFSLGSCSIQGLGLASNSPYADTYYTRTDAARDAVVARQQQGEAAKAAAEEQARLDAERARSIASTDDRVAEPSETILGPDDFASYQEYRDYLDRVQAKPSKRAAVPRSGGCLLQSG